MNDLRSRRYITFFVIVLIFALHYLFSLNLDTLQRATSAHILSTSSSTGPVSNSPSSASLELPQSFPHSPQLNGTQRANATFVLLCRNSDIAGVVSSIQSVEDRFNHKYNYPWVLLNDVEFTEQFKQRVRILTKASVSFGLIARQHWYQPTWIDEAKARAGRLKMMDEGIIYGGSVPYRNMCRFNSGFFFHHPLLQQYRYYWRPDVKFFCDINYDPFVYMNQHDKVSFTISLLEWGPTVETLWRTVREFMALHSQYISPNNAMDFLSDDGGQTYNLCHFWSNFEIADMDFWRSEAYTAFFNYLESTGGFYYERWVHQSIATALFARKDQIHFFRDIGYKHEWFQHCPTGEQWKQGRCSCDQNDSFDYTSNSCLNNFEKMFL
ncbi:glycosyltransferase family 15 protein [Mycena floridula]|nr:glycosyltransferase family 15 protein [Mycena floridula]